MKKKLLPLFFTCLLINSCQDEFCLDPTTPNLIIRFYDSSNTTETKQIELVIWANDLDTIYNNVLTDSISLPLNTESNAVVYHFSQTGIQKDITINYTTKDVFVSKSCGFKSVFENVNVDSSNSDWLISSETLTNSILNETQAHVKIYH